MCFCRLQINCMAVDDIKKPHVLEHILKSQDSKPTPASYPELLVYKLFLVGCKMTAPILDGL